EISGSAIDINVPVAFGQPNVGLISAAFNPDGCVLVDTCSFNGNTAPDNSAVIVSPDGNVLFRGVNTATGTQTIRNSGHLSSGNENTPFDEAMIPFEYIPNGVSTFSSIAGTLRTGVIGNPDFNIQDRLRFGRPLTFGGGLLVDFVGGQIPPGGSSYRIIDILDGATGLFDTTFITGLPPNRQAVIQYSLDSDAGGGGLQEPGVDVLIIDLDDPLAFQDPTSFGLPGVPSDTALLDANLDGFIDLAAIVPGVPSVFVLLNNGTETDNWLGFEVNPVIEVALGSVPLAVSAGNLDNALGDDIAISTMNDRIQTLLSIGSGQYLLDQSLPLASAALDLIIDEFTGDGEDDIATLSNTTITIVNEDEERIEVAVTAIRVYPNDGTGTLAPAVSSFISETPGTSLAAADFDTDNTVDIAFAFDRPATDEEDGIAILTNSGGGQMSLVAVRNTGEDPGDIEPSDLDEDKDVDIVALDTNGIVVIENEFIDATTALNGPQGGQFSPTVSLTLENSPTSIAAVDLDNDGDRDLAVTLVNTVGDSGVRVFRNDLNAGQLIFAEAGELAAGSNPVLVLSADVDGDESADLITVNSTLPAASPPLVHGGREGSGSTVPPALGPSEFGSIDVLINMSEAVPLSCPADCAPLGGNGTVNVDDLITVINNFGQAGQCDVTPANPDGTFGNGIINVDDLIAVINAFGDCG
ncbi:MAG: VCBS repeat-containing protein, partial [Planctomycetota bacterium]